MEIKEFDIKQQVTKILQVVLLLNDNKTATDIHKTKCFSVDDVIHGHQVFGYIKRYVLKIEDTEVS